MNDHLGQSVARRWTLHLTGTRWKECRGGGYLGGGEWVVEPEFHDLVEESVQVMPVAEHEAEVRRLKMQMQDMREGLCDVLKERDA